MVLLWLQNVVNGDNMAYYLIIGATLVIILAYMFSNTSQKIAVPSVIMLILLGFFSKKIFNIGIEDVDWVFPLEILGIVTLMLIVLEGALDLKLSSERWPMIWKSGLIVLLALLINVIANIGGTLVLSLVVGFLMIIFFQPINTQVKLFLFISVLLLLCAVGKVFHLSSLLIILVFGLILENRHIFFFGPLKKYLREIQVKQVLTDFKLFKAESRFVVHAFFFFVFGLNITIVGIFHTRVMAGSFIFLVIIFAVRWILFKLIVKKNFMTELYIAPRGLITVLLCFAIPDEFIIKDFNSGFIVYHSRYKHNHGMEPSTLSAGQSRTHEKIGRYDGFVLERT